MARSHSCSENRPDASLDGEMSPISALEPSFSALNKHKNVSVETPPKDVPILDVCRGLGKGQLNAPTIKSVRKMKNMLAARSEINRRLGPAGGFSFEAYVNPLEYSRWDPNIFLAYDIGPMKWLQEEFLFEYAYEPDPTIPINVKGRIVQSGTIKNRIIERAIGRKLNSNADAHFSDRSWAYRPRRSAQMAILPVRDAARRGFNWALKTDIEHFFPSINRNILEQQLRRTFADERLCEMILRANSPISPRLSWIELWERTEGVPQGNALSPFLSNLFLHGFDEACSNLEYRRYADDILVLGRTREEVVEAQQQIERLLTQLGLRLNPKKTLIRDLYRQPLIFLGFEIRGGNVYPPMKAILKFERQLRVPGQEAHEKIILMKGFVKRYAIGPVRKLFRRVDRELHQWYPQGVTLTGLLDYPASFSKSVYSSRRVFAGPTGKAASVTAKKAHLEQAPVVAAAGEQDSVMNLCSLAPMEESCK
jgi:RNA-directed DNA polymerase